MIQEDPRRADWAQRMSEASKRANEARWNLLSVLAGSCNLRDN